MRDFKIGDKVKFWRDGKTYFGEVIDILCDDDTMCPVVVRSEGRVCFFPSSGRRYYKEDTYIYLVHVDA